MKRRDVISNLEGVRSQICPNSAHSHQCAPPCLAIQVIERSLRDMSDAEFASFQKRPHFSSGNSRSWSSLGCDRTLLEWCPECGVIWNRPEEAKHFDGCSHPEMAREYVVSEIDALSECEEWIQSTHRSHAREKVMADTLWQAIEEYQGESAQELAQFISQRLSSQASAYEEIAYKEMAERMQLLEALLERAGVEVPE